jgi:hypothetical protein
MYSTYGIGIPWYVESGVVGVGSARKIRQRSVEHDEFEWETTNRMSAHGTYRAMAKLVKNVTKLSSFIRHFSVIYPSFCAHVRNDADNSSSAVLTGGHWCACAALARTRPGALAKHGASARGLPPPHARATGVPNPMARLCTNVCTRDCNCNSVKPCCSPLFDCL